MVESLEPGATDLSMNVIGSHDGYLYGFTQFSGSTSHELFRTDGTTSGAARRLAMPALDWFEGGRIVGDSLMLGVETEDAGLELWVADAALTSVALLLDLNPGNDDGLVNGIESSIVFDDRLFFLGDDGQSGAELWATDGTAAGTQLVKDTDPTGDGEPDDFFAHNGFLYFSATSDDGREAWVSDGTTGGTQQLVDIVPGSSSSDARQFAVLGDQVLFQARNAQGTLELWSTDGTPGGTAEIVELTGLASGGEFELYDGRLYFSGFPESGAALLWATDGTAAGTQIVVQQVGGISLAGPTQLTATPNGLLVHFEDIFDNEWWVTDGTAAGTMLLADLSPGTSSNPRTRGTLTDGRVLFTIRENVSDDSLWITDGTTAGTHKLTNLGPGSVELNQSGATFASDMGAVFSGRIAGDNELWGLGPFTRYGTGSAGSGGVVPRLELSGDATPGGTLQVDVTGGFGGAQVFAFLGFDPAEVPFGFGGHATLLVDFVQLFHLGMLSGSGAGAGNLSLATSVPGGLGPVSVLMQLAVVDPGAASGEGFSTGDAVQMIVED